MLNKTAINEFKEIWQKEYGQKIEYSEAEVMANKFIALMRIIYKPIPKQNNEKTNKK